MTKIKVVSDIHLEFQNRGGGANDVHVPFDNEQILILAGDVQVGLDLEYWFAHLLEYRDVVYILGNHEFYKQSFIKINENFLGFEYLVNGIAESLGYKHKLYCLQNREIELYGTRFFGATLWTDINKKDPLLMWNAKNYMNDFNIISNFTAERSVEEHEKSLKLIKKFLKGKSKNKRVVITHHAPSSQSSHPIYKGNVMNPFFYSNLEEVAARSNLWVHGHMHNSSEYNLDSCRVICNPRGYWPDQLNLEYNPNLIVEL